ncbi:MAG: type II toxin-antitoxin system RelE/ParE family toxin [Planctomycetota bacterium]
MEVTFEADKWKRLEGDSSSRVGLHPDIIDAYQRKLSFIRAAVDERDIRRMKSWRYEKLKGDREGQYSIRIKNQFRLIFTIKRDEAGSSFHVIEIVDHH